MDSISHAPKIFDEEAYLRLNLDVARAVESGQFSSGWQHAVMHGYIERRAGLTQAVNDEILVYRNRVEEAAGAVPPTELRVRVHGDDNIFNFLIKGDIIAHNIEQNLVAHNITLPLDAIVLDFGCGCGRVISYLKERHTSWRIKGSDIDQEAIQWCINHISNIAEFKRNEILPPINYSSASFDLTYAISVFTHLPEEMQFAWLGELARITKPSGVLFLSTHNVDLLCDQDPSLKSGSGFYYLNAELTPGLPEFYQNSYHGHEYIRSKWARYFNLVSIVPKGINGHQDLVICRTRNS